MEMVENRGICIQVRPKCAQHFPFPMGNPRSHGKWEMTVDSASSAIKRILLGYAEVSWILRSNSGASDSWTPE